MRKQLFYVNLIAAIFCGTAFVGQAAATSAVSSRTQTILLGETLVRVNIYEKPGAAVTFFSPHHNEQIALRLAKLAVEENGGRLVEIESFDDAGNPARRLNFKLNGSSYSVDPNRIFTANGRTCAGLNADADSAVKHFADELLRIIFPENGELPSNERFLVAVHNNSDAGEKRAGERSSDLTAVAYAGEIGRADFQKQAAGVYLSNDETDADNFIFLSTPEYIGYFAQKGFNVVVQKPLNGREDKRCTVDDGSLSIYSAAKNIPYICLEADAKNGAVRQRQMFDAVYDLIDEKAKQNFAMSGFQRKRQP